MLGWISGVNRSSYSLIEILYGLIMYCIKSLSQLQISISVFLQFKKWGISNNLFTANPIYNANNTYLSIHSLTLCRIPNASMSSYSLMEVSYLFMYRSYELYFLSVYFDYSLLTVYKMRNLIIFLSMKLYFLAQSL